MTEIGGSGVYQTTIMLPVGADVDYSFSNGNSVSGAESAPPPCGSSGIRDIIVPAMDETLDVVCFAS